MTTSLEGIKVIQTARVMAGPMAGRLLADWGADVIYIEHPIRGDPARTSTQQRIPNNRIIQSDINYSAQQYNRNKRGMTLNLSSEGGREILYKLLTKADVFLSNFRPRELEKFELEYDTLRQLNPRLICANLTGYGKRGADKNLPAYEATGYFSRAGVLHVLQMPGSPPSQWPWGLGDNVTGLALACGVMTALFIRERTGVGQEVDVSLLGMGVFAISYDIAASLVTGQDRQPVKREDGSDALFNPYCTKDGRWLWIALFQPDLYWSAFCRAIERQDIEHDPRFETFEARTQNHAALFHILEEAFLSKTLAEWKVRLNEAGLAWSVVQSLPEVIADPQIRANDYFVPMEHPTYGRMEVVANPIRLSKTPATIRMPAPEFGQHTEEILLEYGYTWEDISHLREQGIIA